MKRIFTYICFISICVCIHAQWTIEQVEKGSSSKNDIRAICFDRVGNLWLGTSYGVYKQESAIFSLQSPEGVYVESLLVDPHGTKFAGVWGGGVYKSSPENNDWVKCNDASISMSANSIFADSKGRVWIGTWNKGLVLLDGNAYKNYTTHNTTIGDNTITCFAEDKQSRIWVGSLHGVSSFDEKKGALYNINNSALPSNDIYALAPDTDKSIWIGTACGLANYNNGKWKIYDTGNFPLLSNTILSLAVDSKGILWVGTHKGITAIKGNRFRSFTTQNSNLIDNRIQTIGVHADKLYVGTQLGLAILDLKSFSL